MDTTFLLILIAATLGVSSYLAVGTGNYFMSVLFAVIAVLIVYYLFRPKKRKK